MLWSDAWILLATVYAAGKESASLDEVIGAADYIQHAIVTFEEMEGALDRLTTGDFIVFSNGRLSPSQKTLEYYESISKQKRRVLDEQQNIEDFIGAQRWQPGDDPTQANKGASFPDLDRSEFDAAIQAYISKAEKIIERIMKK